MHSSVGKAIFLLSNESILDTLAEAEHCLVLFLSCVDTLYSRSMMIMNCQLLLHLADSVRSNRPLLAVNCFVLEDLNGFLLQYVHGICFVASQLMNTRVMVQTVPVSKDL